MVFTYLSKDSSFVWMLREEQSNMHLIPEQRRDFSHDFSHSDALE